MLEMHKMLTSPALTGAKYSATSEISCLDGDEAKSTPSSDAESSQEIESLKSTLAMVAALAQQAHDATLQERREHAEKIKALEIKLGIHVPNESDVDM
jgi:hypothetical protein